MGAQRVFKNQDRIMMLVTCSRDLFCAGQVGSGSNAGAGSPIMRDAVERITAALPRPALGGDELFRASLERSLILSVDMAHALHPNYAAKHEKAHAPRMNGGPVLKSNANQRYATSGETGFLLRELGRRAGLDLQEFVVRNDCPCGSTIGPVVAANTGVRAVDLGMPQLSMHSCREMMGRSDLTHAARLFEVRGSDGGSEGMRGVRHGLARPSLSWTLPPGVARPHLFR